MRNVILLVCVLFVGAGCHSVSPPPPPNFSVDSTVAGPIPGPEFGQAIDDADVVYLGESHDDRGHHALEEWLLRQMAEGSGPVLLGLEMFQRPYQQHLDDYIAGRIDEPEMLRRTEYFTRWKYDYTFYAPMWRFCREHGLRVVALNAPAEVNRRVGREGLDALTAEERSQIAEDIDLTVETHRARVRAIMEEVHPMPEPAITYMIEGQTVWDETMAESAAVALEQAGPGARMLVVAGRFHIQGRDGIPDRVAKRIPGLSHLVIVARTEGRAEEEPEWSEQDADLIVNLSAATPKFGAALQPPEEGPGLLITRVVPGSSAALAGLAVGDVVERLGDRVITDFADFRYVLDAHRVGDHLACWARRGDELFAFDLSLRPAAPQPALGQ